MNANNKQSLSEFLYDSRYVSNLTESIIDSLKEAAELDGAQFDLKDSYWADRLHYKITHEIKSNFADYGIHL